MNRRGFTLIETLVVIAIISVVAAILFPVLSQSQVQARKTDDLSKLRQLGQAGAIYEERYGAFPVSTTELVAVGLVPKLLCQSVLDKSAEGIANDTARHSYKVFRGVSRVTQAEYKNSFVGPGEFGLSQKVVNSSLMTGMASGWLIDVVASEKSFWPTPTQWAGTYRRLTYEGSVIKRKHEDFQCYDNGVKRPCRMSVLLYTDVTPEFVERQRLRDSRFSSSRP